MYSRARLAASLLLAALLILLTGCGVSSPFSSGDTPKAAINVDSSLNYPGYPILFSGLGSTDAQDPFLTYSWNFGDGQTGSGVRLIKGYAQIGTYTVTLKVTNQAGRSDTASIAIRIVAPNSVPTANAGGPYSGAIGASIQFNGAASSDPQGLALTYAWNFGDGGTATGVSPRHTYTGPGGYNVTLAVTNTLNIVSTANATASIAYPSPAVTINGPYNGQPTLAIPFTSTVTEPYDASFRYQWSFGDGTFSAAANPIHTYAAAGTYTVTLTVIGQYQETATVTSTATIAAQTSTGALSGVVQSGSTPVAGAHVRLFAASTTGYGQPSVPLLASGALTDAYGPYVLASSAGSFTIPAGMTCGAHQQVYLYATGGAVGGNSNPATGLLAALGACGAITPTTAVTVDEATTIAAAYALAGYATSPTAVSSPNTTAAQTGIANAFLNAANLASRATGQAVAKTTNGTAPQAAVGTLANILNACVNSASGSAACTTLLGTTQAADTAGAALAIAHGQSANVGALYGLQQVGAPFQPSLAAAPHDFALGVTFSGLQGYGTYGLAIDGNGNVWVLQYPRNYANAPSLAEFSSNGVLQQSFDTTCNALTSSTPNAIAIDPANNVYLLTTSGATYYDANNNAYSYTTAQYCTLNAAGTMLSPPGGYDLGGGSPAVSVSLYSLAIGGDGTAYFPSTTLLGRTLNGGVTNGGGYIEGNAPYGLGAAIDGLGNFWVSAPTTNGLVKLSATGALLSPANGFQGGGLALPASVAIDNSGNVWAIDTEQNYPNAGLSLSKLSPAGVPLSGAGIKSVPGPYSIAIDGGSNAWVASGYNVSGTPLSVYELAPSGAASLAIAHANQSREYLNGPQSLAVDSSGSVWVSNGLDYTVTQFVGASIPVVTPLASNLRAPYNAPASKP